MDSTVIAAAVGPVITALLAALGFWLRDLRQRRNREQAYRQAVAHAREQVAFLDGWLATHQKVAPGDVHEEVRRRVLSELDRVYTQVNVTLSDVQRHSEPLTVRRIVAGLLLRGSMNTRAAKIAGVFYYVGLGWLVLWVSAAVLFGFGIAAGGEGSFVVNAASGLGVFALALAIGGVPVLVLSGVVRALDRAPTAAGAAPTAPSPTGWVPGPEPGPTLPGPV